MSAAEIIREIGRLPPTEQAEVIQFAWRLDAERMFQGAVRAYVQELTASHSRGRIFLHSMIHWASGLRLDRCFKEVPLSGRAIYSCRERSD